MAQNDILNQNIKYLPGVGPGRMEILNRELNIYTWGDLLEYYPYKYVDRSRIYRIDELDGQMPFVQIKGRILSFEEFAMSARRKRIIAHFSDGHGVVDLIWWQGSKYIYKTYIVGEEYIVFGKPSIYGGRYQFNHPEIDKASDMQLSSMGMQPYYITTDKMKQRGLMSRTMEKITQGLVEKIAQAEIPETLPAFITGPRHLIPRKEAYVLIHYPRNVHDVQKAQERLKFEELFYVELSICRFISARKSKYKGYVLERVGDTFNDFYRNNLPFPLTEAQKRVMHEIRNDLRSGRQMNRLLQGDVGSGKTLVALMTMLIAVDNDLQACIMAPTEILAEQHYQTITEFLKGLNVRVELLTGTVKGKRREKILQGLLSGEVNILVGTHAVIEDTVQFSRLGIAIIDEQHRFGVAQRAKLWQKNVIPPHVMVMTATPIPRTLQMTFYGDLDVSVIDELPPGRKPVMTIHRYESQVTSLYNSIRKQIQEGRQVYVVYPLITESEKIDLQDLEAGYENLKKVFPEFRLSKIHGKMKPQEKDSEMQRFVSGETQILVATTVIEVGVNVPNASVMVIMEAQRFGLSQLHQLRGRVGRGADQSYCVLVTDVELTKETRMRLDIMCETNDGFKIAEADLKLRGSGDLEGTRQSGIPIDLKIANLATDQQLVTMARDEAMKITEADPTCSKPEYSMLWRRLKEIKNDGAVDWGVIS